ncbi:MAG: V-type ATP synthase subunit E [Clostridiales bacterium]|nr:V-type ATP synthase subunit E [Clostridiales bacterium]MCD7857358.1 V-type ATP synthase subunit E [Clostridiales bacterium]
MTGIEKIIQRIDADAQAEVDAILSRAQEQADATAQRYQAQADQVSAEALAKGEADAREREERLCSAAEMQSRQLLLKTRQEMLDEAFQLALEKLQSLPPAEMTELLAKLAAQASSSGREQVVLDEATRAQCGPQVVARANELLGGKGKLSLSPETGRFQGGLVLSDGGVEVNCAFPTLVRLARNQTAGEVAKVLFDETPS